jgi:glycosyltransferase involved in cell wall biosynthesis
MKVSVVIPVYNEANTVAEILRRVQAVKLKKEIIVVDDGSTDGTSQLLSGYGKHKKEDPIKVFQHKRNRGKGAALRTGFEAITGDVVIIQDADLEYDPREYPKLLKPILDGEADVVYGSRFLGLPWGAHPDMETGFKVFRAEILRKTRLISDRFGFEPEITAKIAKMGFRVHEVPISYSGRSYRDGKKIGWRDGVSALWSIVRFNLIPNTGCSGSEVGGPRSNGERPSS